MSPDLRGLDVILGRRYQHKRPKLYVVGAVGIENKRDWAWLAWAAALAGAVYLAFGGKSAYVTPPRRRK